MSGRAELRCASRIRCRFQQLEKQPFTNCAAEVILGPCPASDRFGQPCQLVELKSPQIGRAKYDEERSHAAIVPQV